MRPIFAGMGVSDNGNGMLELTALRVYRIADNRLGYFGFNWSFQIHFCEVTLCLCDLLHLISPAASSFVLYPILDRLG